MSDDIDENSHPSTFKAVRTHSEGIDWDDHATVHLDETGGGLFDGLTGINRGTLAEMVAHVSRLPEDQRGKYVIQKSGDQRFGISEIMALSEREDFPLRG